MINRFAIIVVLEQHIVHPEVTVTDYLEFILRTFARFYSYLIYAIGHFSNLFRISSEKNIMMKLMFAVFLK